VGNENRNNIARINADGSVNAWNPDANGDVSTIAISGSDVYVGGWFSSIGGQTRNRIAKLNNTTGAADPTWNPGANISVRTIAISGSDVYVGGWFSSIGGQPRNNIAKLNNTTGAADPTWNPDANGNALTIAISGSDVYVGGTFTIIGGQTRNRIAKLNNTTGAADPTWNPNANDFVITIAISSSDVYAGGGFTSIGGQTRNYIVKLNNTNGNADLTWNPDASGSSPYTIISTIAISGSDVYAGGIFTSIGGQTRHNIARLNNTNGNADLTWNSHAGGAFLHSYGSVSSIALNGSDVYVGGGFTSIGGVLRNNIAKLDNTTGNADLTWDANASNEVYTIAISGNEVYAGGFFTSIGGQPRNRIAKLNNTTGAADHTWNPIANNWVQTIAISGSDVYAGGRFTSIGGQTRNRIAKLDNTTGTADLTWNPDANHWVSTIAISDNEVYAGGWFSSIGGHTRNRIAKLNNTTGATDPTWNPDADNAVSIIAISGSDVYAGGGFTSIGGQTRNYIAKLNNTNGNADLTWNPDVSNGTSSSIVYTIAISNSDVYVGGVFGFIGGQTRNYLAKLNNTNGNADLTWNPDAANGGVHSITISGSDVYAGGFFYTMNGNFQPCFALFTKRELPVELITFTANANQGRVILNWSTATETNNRIFEIERRAVDDGQFITIGFIEGHGTTTEPKDYTYMDVNVVPGQYYYRLKQIDFDGSFEYSNILDVYISPSDFELSQNYPNPFNPSTTIKFALPEKASVTITVFNMLGEKVTDLFAGEKEAGYHQISFNAANLPSGVYVYRLNTGNFLSTKKMMLIK
jgi:hypothetical protein